MLDRPSFDQFKTELNNILFPYSNFHEISNAINAINDVEFKSHDPKRSYFELSQALKNSPQVPVPQQAAILSAFSSIINTSFETKANNALSEVKNKAINYHLVAMLKQDTTAAGIGIHLADVMNVKNGKTNETLTVITNRGYKS